MNDGFHTEKAAVQLHVQNRIVLILLYVIISGRQEGTRVSAIDGHCPHAEKLSLTYCWLTPFELKLLVSLHHLRGHHALDLQGEGKWEGMSRSLCIFIDRNCKKQLVLHYVDLTSWTMLNSDDTRTDYLLTNNALDPILRQRESNCQNVFEMHRRAHTRLNALIYWALKWTLRLCEGEVNYKVKAWLTGQTGLMYVLPDWQDWFGVSLRVSDTDWWEP